MTPDERAGVLIRFLITLGMLYTVVRWVLIPTWKDDRAMRRRTSRERIEIMNEAGAVVEGETLAVTATRARCAKMLETYAGRIRYFEDRIVEEEADPKAVAILIVAVDDVRMVPLANAVTEIDRWKPIAMRGATPVVRAVIERERLEMLLFEIDPYAADRCRELGGIPVVAASGGRVTVAERPLPREWAVAS